MYLSYNTKCSGHLMQNVVVLFIIHNVVLFIMFIIEHIVSLWTIISNTSLTCINQTKKKRNTTSNILKFSMTLKTTGHLISIISFDDVDSVLCVACLNKEGVSFHCHSFQ